MTVEIRRAPSEFCEWELLLKLLQTAFGCQNGRIDPPSSVPGLDAEALALKAKGELLGCVFARPQPGSLYVGKLAVWPHRQGQGMGRRLVQAAEEAFAALGFVKTAEHAHDGYDHPTFITMRKRLGMTLVGKTFRAVANSSNGTINTDTTMTFVSEDQRGILGARFSQAPDEPLRMHLDWQWLTGDQSKGTSGWVLESS